MQRVDWRTARQEIMATLIADAASDATAFAGDGISVVEWRDLPGRRRFDMPPKTFQIFTTGHAVVVSCHSDWLEWTQERAAALDRDRFLAPANISAIVSLLEPAGLELVGPHMRYGCSGDTLRDVVVPPGVELGVFEGAGMGALGAHGAFPNALSPRPNPRRPDTLAVTASVGGKVIACAGASDENGRLWQIGVDVHEPWQGRGIGRAIVHRLTEAILDAGKVPYYSHSISNVRSAALATSLGYWPAWVQWYALEHR